MKPTPFTVSPLEAPSAAGGSPVSTLALLLGAGVFALLAWLTVPWQWAAGIAAVIWLVITFLVWMGNAEMEKW
jgi:hypothetical protein